MSTPKLFGHCESKLELMNERTYIQLNQTEAYLKLLLKIQNDNASIIAKALDNLNIRLNQMHSTINALYLGFKNNPCPTEEITESDEECAGHTFIRSAEMPKLI